MILFVNLGRQTGPLRFAFFNASINRFVKLADQQVWESWADFECNWQQEYILSDLGDGPPLDLFRTLLICDLWPDPSLETLHGSADRLVTLQKGMV